MLYQYRVDFEPLVESKRLRIGLLKQHDEMFANSKAFDGQDLFSLTKLDKEVNNAEQFYYFFQL